MKRFESAIKDILVLIAYIGPLILIGWSDMNIVLKAIIGSVTFLYNAFYHYRTEGISQELSDLKYSYDKTVKQLDEAYIENVKLRQELDKYSKMKEGENMNNSREYKGTCTACGEKNCQLVIVDEENHLCKKCLDEDYFLCEECGEYWSYDYVEDFLLKDGRTVCEYCAEDYEDEIDGE